MSLQPKGEAVRKAVEYISEEKLANPNTSLTVLIQQACIRFDLTPRDAQFLEQFYRDGGS